MKNANRFVTLYTWYISANGKRQFCLVHKSGKHVDDNRAGGKVSIYQTTLVGLSEPLNPNPIYYDMDRFWELVDEGKLIEYIPGVTQLPGASDAPKPMEIVSHQFEEEWP